MSQGIRRPAVSIRFPRPILARLEAIADALGMKRAELVNRYVLDGLERHERHTKGER